MSRIETPNVFNPRTGKEETVTKTRVRIFSSYKENRFLPVSYVAELEGITDPNKRKAWLGGRWDISSGGAVDDLWTPATHVLPRFVVPSNWELSRSFDKGSTHPASVGFWAIANGEEVQLPNGRIFCPEPGSLIRCGEIYTAQTIEGSRFGHNKGDKRGMIQLAKDILEEEAHLIQSGWVADEFEPGPADGQIFGVDDSETDSIAKRMESVGVTWRAADKSKGTRKMGFELFRQALENSLKGEGPGLYVMDHCEAFIETIPNLPRSEKDPDDVDTDSEDHVYDEARYMVLDDKESFAKEISFGFAQ